MGFSWKEKKKRHKKQRELCWSLTQARSWSPVTRVPLFHLEMDCCCAANRKSSPLHTEHRRQCCHSGQRFSSSGSVYGNEDICRLFGVKAQSNSLCAKEHKVSTLPPATNHWFDSDCLFPPCTQWGKWKHPLTNRGLYQLSATSNRDGTICKDDVSGMSSSSSLFMSGSETSRVQGYHLLTPEGQPRTHKLNMGSIF